MSGGVELQDVRYRGDGEPPVYYKQHPKGGEDTNVYQNQGYIHDEVRRLQN